jgi:hypothetical protein
VSDEGASSNGTDDEAGKVVLEVLEILLLFKASDVLENVPHLNPSPGSVSKLAVSVSLTNSATF